MEKLPVTDESMAENEPKYIRTKLNEYQLQGIDWMHWRENMKRLNDHACMRGGILADDMGLGQ